MFLTFVHLPSIPGFSSFLAVDKRLFGRLQDELTAAQSELRLKEEEVSLLNRYFLFITLFCIVNAVSPFFVSSFVIF